MQAIRIEQARTLFVVVPKTGSTSIRRRLFDGKLNSADWEYVTDCRREKWPGWFRFAFIRDPWDRLVSCWCEKIANRSSIFRGFKQFGWPDRMSFPAFIRAIADLDPARHEHHFASQWSLITQGDELCVDFIGRFERLDEDFRRLFPGQGRLGHYITSSRGPAAAYYTPDLCEIVERTFSDDIERFGYPRRP